MEIREAAAMLNNDRFNTMKEMVWSDLGCGNGTFTLALATLLSPGSQVYAIDHNAASLQQVPQNYNQVSIQKYQADFIHGNFPFHAIDGILMANALHYVQHKADFIKKTAAILKQDGCFLIVEYNTDQPVPVWVPFPASFTTLQSLFQDAGFSTVQQLSERPSVYGHAPLYSAIIKRSVQ